MKQNVIVVFLFALLLHGCNQAAKSPYPDIQWEKKKDIPLAGLSSAAAASINNKAYVVFGRKAASSSYTNELWEYDATTDNWTQKKSCPGIPRVNGICIALNGKIYAGLGFSGTNYNDESYLGDFWMYDPATDEWEQKADYPTYSTDKCAGFIHDNKIFAGIGFHGTEFGAYYYRYDPENDTWTQLDRTTAYHRSASVACNSNSRIFMGTGYKTYNLNDWWEYYPGSETMKRLKDMPDEGRSCAVALCVNDRFFVSTGKYFRGDQNGGGLKSDICEYDPVRNVWYKRGNMPAPARENAVSFTINGKGYIGLGESENGLLNDLWCFEP